MMLLLLVLLHTSLCFASKEKTCYEENKVFLQESLPFSLSLDQCFAACKSLPVCKVCTVENKDQLM